MLAFVLAGAGLFAFARACGRLGTPEFRRELLAATKAALGTEVGARPMQVSVLQGFRLRGLRIANPHPFTGDLLTAESARLGYDLWPLLRGRLQIDELAVDEARHPLAADRRAGRCNYEQLKPYTAAGRPGPRRALAQAPPSCGSSWSRELAMKDAALSLAEGTRSSCASTISTSRAVWPWRARAAARARPASAPSRWPRPYAVRDMQAPIMVSKPGLRLDPIEARLAGGPLKGKIRLDLVPDLRWAMDLGITGASVATLLKEAGAAPSLSGSLDATAALAGTGGAPTAKGKGRAQIHDCRVLDHAVTRPLAALLQLPELARRASTSAVVEFELWRAAWPGRPLRFKSRCWS